MTLKLISVCTLAISLSAYGFDGEAISSTPVKTEVKKQPVKREKDLTNELSKRLTMSNDLNSILAHANLLNDKNYEHYNEENAYYFYLNAVKRGALAAYTPLIEILINKRSPLYDLGKAGMYANSYVLKNGDGAEGLLSYILILSKSVNQNQIFELANLGYKKKHKYSVLALGHIHENGIGTSQNYIASLIYFSKAKEIGLDVESDIERVTINKLSPKISNLKLYAAKREDVNKTLLLNNGVKKLDSKQHNIDIYLFDNNANKINTVTMAYSSAHALIGVKYVFDTSAGQYQSLKNVIKDNFGIPQLSKDKASWSSPLINVFLSKVSKCISGCNKINKVLKNFVELEYGFTQVGLTDYLQEANDETSFKF